MTQDVHKTLILGSGPAGCTAAIYAARASLAPTLLRGNEPGGQLMITTDVENFPGYPEGITGPAMMQELEQQAERFGTSFIGEVATSVDLSARPFKIETNLENTHLASTLIIATGATANYLGLESEEKLKGRGVSACATCDGFFFRDKDVCVVGGGDSAIEEATYLTNHASKVHMLVRRDEFRGSKIMRQRAFDNPKIQIQWNTEVQEVLGFEAGKVTGLRLINNKSGEVFEQATDGFFLGIGHTPNTDLFKAKLDMDESGYLVTKADSAATNIPGVYAAGDCQDSIYRQAITAAGSGCMAAIEVERFLEANQG